MEVVIEPNDPGLLAARLAARLVREKPQAVLGLSTGETPRSLYRELVRLHRDEALDFGQVRTFNLDEYIGLGPGHPASYHRYMEEEFFRHVNVAQTHIPDGLAADIPAACAAYERAIADAGGIDLQILGIGADGHIGFNEPGSSLASRTRLKSLTRRTREDNARNFSSADEVPRHVLTMGVGTIMEAREILLLARGKAKAPAVAAAVEGPVTASVPASILQMHPNVKALLDEAAAARLVRADYYRWVYANKPDWQRF